MNKKTAIIIIVIFITLFAAIHTTLLLNDFVLLRALTQEQSEYIDMLEQEILFLNREKRPNFQDFFTPFGDDFNFNTPLVPDRELEYNKPREWSA